MNKTITTDPLADMLARIRNALSVRKGQINLSYSVLKSSVSSLLNDSNFIVDVQVAGEGVSKALILVLQDGSQASRLTSIDRISKPGRRYYVSAQEIPIIKRGRGIVIISTSKGLMK